MELTLFNVLAFAILAGILAIGAGILFWKSWG
jgi:hypothetical protein